jgi:hypothetical protein
MRDDEESIDVAAKKFAAELVATFRDARSLTEALSYDAALLAQQQRRRARALLRIVRDEN